MTKLDVYDGMEEIKVCTAYSIDGEETRNFPATIEGLNKAEPVVKIFAGWKESVKERRCYDDLPAEARGYIEFIEEYLRTPVEIVSVGPNRSETILRRSPWTPS